MKKKKIVVFLCIFAVMACLSAFAVSADVTTSDISAWNSQITTMFSDYNPFNVLTIVGAGIAIAVPLVLVWFAIRFIIRKVSGALKKGRV